MIEIYTDGGHTYSGVDLSYDIFEKVMNAGEFCDNTVIAFKFESGERGAVIKKHVTGFAEIDE